MYRTLSILLIGLSLAVTSGVTYAAQASAQDRSRDRTQDPATHTGDEPIQARDQDRLYTSTTSAPTGSGNQNQSQNQAASTSTRTQQQSRLMIDPEHVQQRATTSAALGQMIQQRERELAQEAASTTPQNRATIENANEVRLAVHALLASQNLFSPEIGAQIAQIATQIDATVPASANAEAQIEARGFWKRLFFGGDTEAGTTLTQIASQNQEHIRTLSRMLDTASTTPEVRAQLQTQLQTVTQEQTRLMQLADQELSRWGIFSWRW